MHGELVSSRRAGESVSIASPCPRRDIPQPNPLRDIDLSTMRGDMHGERVSSSLDPREHACTWRESGESSTNAYL